MQTEFVILDFIQNLRTPLGDKMMLFFTRLGDLGLIWILLTLLLLMRKETRRTGMILALGLIIEAVICNLGLKPLVARTRPFEINPTVQLLVRMPVDYSFPSGHTAASFAAASGLWFAGCRKPAVTALILSALIAFSRLYLYVHFPTDVAAGLILGVLSGFAAAQIVKSLEKNKKQKHIKGDQ
ncbi:MAG: phosphatase PAP2 family protein [Clostridiales bacterium]|nr:phosphatase PAP2 family protein [Candidatus Blautia equi]